MFFDSDFLPIDSGASDKADSSRLAGLMSLVGHEKAPDLTRYFITKKFFPVRHPTANVYPENEPRVMSRDQLVCLVAGLFAQNERIPLQLPLLYSSMVERRYKYFAPNDMNEKTRKWKIPDILTPSVRNHFRLCSNKPGFCFGYLWLMLDIWANGKWFSHREQNQLISMVLIAGPKYVRLYAKHNPNWRESLKYYWVDSRLHYSTGEPELCSLIIKKVESFL